MSQWADVEPFWGILGSPLAEVTPQAAAASPEGVTATESWHRWRNSAPATLTVHQKVMKMVVEYIGYTHIVTQEGHCLIRERLLGSGKNRRYFISNCFDTGNITDLISALLLRLMKLLLFLINEMDSLPAGTA